MKQLKTTVPRRRALSSFFGVSLQVEHGIPLQEFESALA
jgi:hypothetical protein